jgi:mRNA interferase RelE/StbE
VRYAVEFSKRATRELGFLPQPTRNHINARIRALADDPRPPGYQRLAGFDDLYRVRVGDYRIIYQIQDNVLIVLIVRLGHRRDIYRHMG